MVAGFAITAPAYAFDPNLLCAVPTAGGPEPAAFAIPLATPVMCAPQALGAEAPIEAEDAAEALSHARSLAEAGRHREAILSLRVVAEAEPLLADRLALQEADYRMAAGPSTAACEAYSRALESPHRSVAVEARIGLTRCQLMTGDRDGIDGFADLQRRYPELTMEDELSIRLGQAYEGWGEGSEAAAVYRRVDLMSPGSPWAQTARERLAALSAEGVRIRPLTVTQEVDRAERLVRSGPMDLARSEVARLQQVALPRPLAAQLASAAARIARVEGRFDEAARLLRVATGQDSLTDEERESMTARASDMAAAAEGRAEDEARSRIRQLTRGRSIDRQPTARVFSILRIAARAGLTAEVNQAAASILRRDRMPPGLCFDAALVAAGTGDDASVAALFERAMHHPRYAVQARYHYARTLERMGQLTDARAAYAQVVAEDSPRLPFYAMWSRSRLLATQEAAAQTPASPELAFVSPPAAIECAMGPFTFFEDQHGKTGEIETSCVEPGASPTGVASASEPPPTDSDDVVDPLDEADEVATTLEVEGDGGRRPEVDLSNEQVVALLEPLAEEHGEAFPWLTRAVALVRIGETDAAAAELHETYTAWRDANGRSALRAGLAGVLRGSAPGRHRVSGETWRARRTFPASARTTLARASAALGDYGLSIRFGGSFEYSGARPRAHSDIVHAAADRHGIEPELLFAVMRVESVYNPRIISYAGAIGLMQIMPRTGRLIANARGRDDFTVDHLLDPETNIDFAAWYLASLIERFDGRVPLAVASYNGGPHNVRRWMHSYSADLPLDAFLERIEFAQTHRYVRRVLTHYEAYRAQRGEPMIPLDVTLPDLEADTVAF
ncbi:MAG: transglycosylase SLT domain-containing protein [Sandaracinaceae bacterium]